MAATQQDRVNTIIALISAAPALNAVNINKIKTEFKQVTDVDVVQPGKRKNILKVLHSTRGLDSTLKAFLLHHGILNNKHSIGQYLIQLTNHNQAGIGKLGTSERSRYQKNIVAVRNVHLHNADSYPNNDSEVYTLISEMEALLSRVLSL